MSHAIGRFYQKYYRRVCEPPIGYGALRSWDRDTSEGIKIHAGWFYDVTISKNNGGLWGLYLV